MEVRKKETDLNNFGLTMERQHPVGAVFLFDRNLIDRDKILFHFEIHFFHRPYMFTPCGKLPEVDVQ